MSRLFTSYTSFLTRRPLAGNCLTAVGLFAVGDGIAQAIEGKKGYDFARTARLCTWGGAIFAPVIGGFWFPLLNRVTLPSKPLTAITRASMDQFIAAPIVLAGFFTVVGAMEGKDGEEIKKKVESAWLPTLKQNWLVWIPVQAVNLLMPPQYRFLLASAVNIPWNAWLSLQNAKSGGGVVEELKQQGKDTKNEIVAPF